MFSDQNRIRKQAKFTNSPIGKAFWKQAKRIEDQREKQRKPLKSLELPKQVKDTFKVISWLIRSKVG